MPVDSLQKQVGVGEGDAARRQVRSGANWGSSWRFTTDRRNAAADLLQIVIRLF
jgi:hypothetical protein